MRCISHIESIEVVLSSFVKERFILLVLSTHLISYEECVGHQNVSLKSQFESPTVFETIQNVGNSPVASVVRQGYPLLFRWDLPIQ